MGVLQSVSPVSSSKPYTTPSLPDPITMFLSLPLIETFASMGEIWKSRLKRSCGLTWLYQTSFPSRLSAIRELLYRLGPGRLEPLGQPLMPGTGEGFPLDQKLMPVSVSIAGGNQSPPPLLTSGWPQKPFSTTCQNHSGRPVLGFIR